MSRGLTAALVLAAAATFPRAQFIFFPTDVHMDESIIAGLAQRAVETGKLTANWDGVADERWSRPTYQFSPYTLLENALAVASHRLTGFPESHNDQIRFARAFSVVCGGLAVLATYFAARAWFASVATALVAELLLAVAFLHVQDSCYARVEALLSLCVMLAFWAAGAAMNQITTRRCMALGLSIGVAVAVKYNAAPLLLLAAAPLVGVQSRSLGPFVVIVGSSLAGFLLATPEVFSAPSPLVEGVRYELVHYADGHVPHHAMDEGDGNLKFWGNYTARLGYGWAPTIATIGFLGLAARRRDREGLLAVFLVVAAISTVISKVRFERNAEVLLGPACFAAARFVVVSWNVSASASLQAMIRAAIVIGLLGNVVQHGIALSDFRRQQRRSSSPLVMVSEADRRARSLGALIYTPPPSDWDTYEVLLLAGYSDGFSQRGLAEWTRRLGGDWDVTVISSNWNRAGYPFSTVEAYHGPGFVLRAGKRRKGTALSSHQPGLSTEIAPEELHRRRTAGEKVRIIDVRRPDEAAVCSIAGAELIPLTDLPMRMNELNPDEEIVVHCKMGGRSSQAAEFLRANGFRHVRNLTGGILAWIDKVDPTLPKY